MCRCRAFVRHAAATSDRAHREVADPGGPRRISREPEPQRLGDREHPLAIRRAGNTWSTKCAAARRDTPARPIRREACSRNARRGREVLLPRREGAASGVDDDVRSLAAFVVDEVVPNSARSVPAGAVVRACPDIGDGRASTRLVRIVEVRLLDPDDGGASLGAHGHVGPERGTVPRAHRNRTAPGRSVEAARLDGRKRGEFMLVPDHPGAARRINADVWARGIERVRARRQRAQALRSRPRAILPDPRPDGLVLDDSSRSSLTDQATTAWPTSFSATRPPRAVVPAVEIRIGASQTFPRNQASQISFKLSPNSVHAAIPTPPALTSTSTW